MYRIQNTEDTFSHTHTKTKKKQYTLIYIDPCSKYQPEIVPPIRQTWKHHKVGWLNYKS